jgi:hypothetical protein
MKRFLERLCPTPSRRIEVDATHDMRFVEPGEAPVKLGKVKPGSWGACAAVESASVFFRASVVRVDASGRETRSSRLYRARAPLRRVKEKLRPRRLLTGRQFREYFE